MNSYAEFKTDRIVLDTYFPDKTDGIMVEVGAAGPDVLSMSRLFREHGWRTICVEPNPYFAQKQRDYGVEVYQVALSDKENLAADFSIVELYPEYWPLTFESRSALELRQDHVGGIVTTIKVRVTTLTALLTELNVSSVDYVSIDTEGWELEVMRGFDVERFKPQVIVLENFQRDPNYEQYMKERRYLKQMDLGHNQVYVL